jgi:hypothetical protein
MTYFKFKPRDKSFWYFMAGYIAMDWIIHLISWIW